jgi:uncharacterized protein (TIGR00251 family)
MDDTLQELKKSLLEKGEILLEVKAVPGSSYSGISGFLGSALKIKVAAPPEKGKANEEIIQILAETFKVPRSSIQLKYGTTSARKKFHIIAPQNGL